jgi:hypothetical protein
MTKFFKLSQDLKARHVSSIGYHKSQNMISVNYRKKPIYLSVYDANIEQTLDKFDFVIKHKMDSRTIQCCKDCIIENWDYIQNSKTKANFSNSANFGNYVPVIEKMIDSFKIY